MNDGTTAQLLAVSHIYAHLLVWTYFSNVFQSRIHYSSAQLGRWIMRFSNNICKHLLEVNKKYVLWNECICTIASKVGHVTLVSSLKKSDFLSTGTLWAADFPSLYRMWRKNVDRRQNYRWKSKSKMAAVRHLAFSKIWFLSTWTPWAADFLSRCKN